MRATGVVVLITERKKLMIKIKNILTIWYETNKYVSSDAWSMEINTVMQHKKDNAGD
jgi:hypothetical protein